MIPPYISGLNNTKYLGPSQAVIHGYQKFSYSTPNQQSSWSIRTFFILRLVSIRPEI